MVLLFGFHMGFRSRAIPHFGQSPGLSDSTPGHIGQKYFAPEAGFTSVSVLWPPQQVFFSLESIMRELTEA
jgi:hypothetical protein